MELILTEKIKLSEKERKAFDMVLCCCSGIMRECRNHENYIAAEKIFNAINDFYDNLEDDGYAEELTEEHC